MSEKTVVRIGGDWVVEALILGGFASCGLGSVADAIEEAAWTDVATEVCEEPESAND